MKPTVFLISLFLASHSEASSEILVDGATWGFQFEPTIEKPRKAGAASGEFQFEAITKDGFVVSGFVEPAEGKGTSPESCRAYYWKLTSQNPAIVKDSVMVVSEGGQFEAVSYMVVASDRGQRFVQVNANYYGFRDDKCIDVHVSQAWPEGVEPDMSNLLIFAKSFGYTKTK